jgi:hypothetical protein
MPEIDSRPLVVNKSRKSRRGFEFRQEGLERPSLSRGRHTCHFRQSLLIFEVIADFEAILLGICGIAVRWQANVRVGLGLKCSPGQVRTVNLASEIYTERSVIRGPCERELISTRHVSVNLAVEDN